MDIATARKILVQKEPARLYDLVEPALHSTEVRQALVEGSFDKDETFRYNSVRVMFRALNQEPQLFYSSWHLFAEMIDSPNGFHRAAAAQALAGLTLADVDCQLDRIFTRYLRLLDDSKVMVSSYFIQTLDKICRARPDLQSRVVKALLNIDQTSHTLERRELLKADVLGVFDRLFDSLSAKDRKAVLAFATEALQSISGKTRKSAKIFLASHAAWLVETGQR